MPTADEARSHDPTVRNTTGVVRLLLRDMPRGENYPDGPCRFMRKLRGLLPAGSPNARPYDKGVAGIGRHARRTCSTLAAGISAAIAVLDRGRGRPTERHENLSLNAVAQLSDDDLRHAIRSPASSNSSCREARAFV